MSHIAKWMRFKFTEQAFAIFLVGSTAPDGHGFFRFKWFVIINEAEMPQRVELEQYGRSAGANWPAFDEGWKRLALCYIAKTIKKLQTIWIGAGIAMEVKEIHGHGSPSLSEMPDRGPLVNARTVPNGRVAKIVGETVLDGVLF